MPDMLTIADAARRCGVIVLNRLCTLCGPVLSHEWIGFAAKS
jgi:hypothetical protein